jgi:hypothetical protein
MEHWSEASYRLTEMGTLLIDEIIRCVLHLRAWDKPQHPTSAPSRKLPASPYREDYVF